MWKHPLRQVGHMISRRTLSVKILVPFFLVVSIFLSGMGVYVSKQVELIVRGLAADQLAAEAKKMAEKMTLLLTLLTAEQLGQRLEMEAGLQRADLNQRGLTADLYIVSPDGAEALGGNRKPFVVPKEMVEIMFEVGGTSGTRHLQIAGEDYTLAYYKLFELQNRFYMIVVPDKDFLSPFFRLRNALMVTVLLMITLFLLISWLLAKQIGRPLNRLLDSFTEVGQGNLTVRCELSQEGPEFARLSFHFNEMIQSTEKVFRKLYDTVQRLADFEKRLHLAISQNNVRVDQHIGNLRDLNITSEHPNSLLTSYSRLIW